MERMKLRKRIGRWSNVSRWCVERCFLFQWKPFMTKRNRFAHWSIRTLTNQRKEDLGIVGMWSFLRTAWWLLTGSSLDTRLAEIEWVQIHVRTGTVDSCLVIRSESSEVYDGSLSVWLSMLSTGLDSVPIFFVPITDALMCLFTVHELGDLGISIVLPELPRLRLSLYSHGSRILGFHRFPLAEGRRVKGWCSFTVAGRFVRLARRCVQILKETLRRRRGAQRKRKNEPSIRRDARDAWRNSFSPKRDSKRCSQWSSDFHRSIQWPNETNLFALKTTINLTKKKSEKNERPVLDEVSVGEVVVESDGI